MNMQTRKCPDLADLERWVAGEGDNPEARSHALFCRSCRERLRGGKDA